MVSPKKHPIKLIKYNLYMEIKRMPQPIEGVLNQAQRESLEIAEFIFHIIQPDEDVIFMDEVSLQAKQKSFFLDRLRDIAEGTQFIFKTDSVHLKEKCEQLVDHPSRFVELSRQITNDFAERHKGQMSAGVFVVAIVKYLAAPNDWKKLVFLVKMDKGSAIPGQYFNNINHVVEMRHQKHDVACAEYRLECS